MNSMVDDWIAGDDNNARLYLQEKLIVDCTEEIWGRMDELNCSKSALADRLGTTRGYISQVLNGNRNMTLRTLADIAWALGMRPVITFQGPGKADEWGQDSEEYVAVPASHRVVKYNTPSVDRLPANEDWHVAA